MSPTVILKLRRRVAAPLALACAAQLLAACGLGHGLVAAPLSPPTLDPVATTTNQPLLPLSGGRSAEAEVWAVRDSGEQVRLAVAGAELTWTGSLPLREGINGFALVAVRGSSYSPHGAHQAVLLDSQPPMTPAVLAPDGVYLAGAAQASLTLTGTKSADGDVEIDGAVVVPADGTSTTWSAQVTVRAGDNSYAIVSRDAVGNQSATVTLAVFGSQIVPPTIAVLRPPPALNYTNQTSLVITGTKPVAGDLYFVQDATALHLGFVGQSAWTTTMALPRDATFVVGAYVTQTGVDSVHHSPTATATLVRKTSKPAAPSVTVPAGWPSLADSAAASITLGGSLAADSYLCVSATQGGPCIVSTAGTGGSYSISVPLNDGACDLPAATAPCVNNGNNSLWVSARDQAGNVSVADANSHAVIYRMTPPQVTGVTPAAGAVVTTASLAVQLTAAPFSGDAGRAGSAIQSVQICLDGACQAPAVQPGSAPYSATFDLSAAAAGSAHTLAIVVRDGLGASTTISRALVYSPGNAPLYLSRDGSGQTATTPKSAFDGQGNLHVVWQSECSQVGAPQCTAPLGTAQMPPDIFYIRRDAQGAWGSLRLISAADTTDGHSVNPSIAVDGSDNVHIAWADDGQIAGKPARYSIVHRVLAAGGSLGAIDVVGAPDGVTDDTEPSLAADRAAQLVHVAWTHKRNASSEYDIFYSRLSGGAWSPQLQVSSGVGFHGSASVAVAANARAQVAWQGCITDSSLVPPRNYCNASNDPSLAGDPRANINYDIFLAEVASASAVGWTQTVSAASKQTGQDGDSRQPALIIDANNTAWAFYSDNGTLQNQTHRNIWLRRFLDGGTADPTGYVVVSSASAETDAESPAAALNAAGQLAVTWTSAVGTSGNTDISLMSGTVDLGLSQTTTTVYADPDPSNFSTLALDAAGNMHVTWDDQSSFPGGINSGHAEQIFYLYVPR